MRLDGKRIRATRLEQGLPLRRLAKLAGTSPTLLDRIEASGDAATVPAGVIQRIADALGVPVADLLNHQTQAAFYRPRPIDCAVAALGAEVVSALMTFSEGLHVDVIADAAGVEIATVREAAEAIGADVERVGLVVTDHDGHLRLRATARATITNDRLNDGANRRGRRPKLSKSQIRILDATLAGSSVKALHSDTDGFMKARHLVNTGVLVDPDVQTDPYLLSPDARFSLFPEDADGQQVPISRPA